MSTLAYWIIAELILLFGAILDPDGCAFWLLGALVVAVGYWV